MRSASSLFVLCCLTVVVRTSAIGGQATYDISFKGQPGAMNSGALSFTDELALGAEGETFQSVAAHTSLIGTETSSDGDVYARLVRRAMVDKRSHLDDCELPTGAKWCTAYSGGQSWQMAVYAGRDPVSNTICGKGSWEHKEPKDMGVSSGEQLLDIGANVGWYTFMYAQHGYRVLAVEPMTTNRALIKATMCKNPDLASKITVVAAALTDKVDKPDQKCSIFSANTNLGDGMLACSDEQIATLRDKAHNNDKIQHIEREQVPLTTLDKVLESSKLTKIDVMKMDVERFECHVLGGASTMFTRFQPKGMMIETRNSGVKNEVVKPGQIGSTTDCTVKAVMKGGNYKIHKDSIAGPVIEEPTDKGVFNLYFSLE